MPVSGPASNGDLRSAPYQPTLGEFPDSLASCLTRDGDPNMAVPLPPGWKLTLPTDENQLRLSVSIHDADTARAAYGSFRVPSFLLLLRYFILG